MEKQKAKELCESLMEKHKLGKKWRFDWMYAKRTYGACDKRLKTIYLSKRFVECNNEDEVRNTILHEIAHARCRSRKSAHNKYWREWCVKLGARPVRINSTANMPE